MSGFNFCRYNQFKVILYNKTPQIFGDVRRPILGKPSTPPLCRLADRCRRNAGLNWKL